MIKRFVSAALALILAAALAPAASARTPSFALLDISVTAPDSARVRVQAEADCVLLSALYGENGALLAAGQVPITGSGEVQEVSVSLPSGGAAYRLAKAFLIDAGTAQPLCRCVFTTPSGERIRALDLPESWKEELLLAESMGFSMEKLEQESVSGQEMSQLLDQLVRTAAPERLEAWQALLPALAALQEPLTRFDAMAAQFLAARTIGGRWAEPVEAAGPVWKELAFSFDQNYFTPGLFDAVDGPLFASPITPGAMQYLDGACLCYNLGRSSPVSEDFPFPYDREARSIHEDDPPTYAEALLAVTRLLLSAQADPAGEVQPVSHLTQAQAGSFRRELESDIQAILDSETKIRHGDTAIPGETYTGTAYYVSADGDDNNDGLSPDSPWRTLPKVTREAGGWDFPGVLRPGDAVFFRRGDVFRFPETEEERTLHIVTSGLTFSAYGEGPKPVITGSSQSGAGAEKWELYEEKGGVKIWKYRQDLRDVASVICNGGEVIAQRVYEYFDGTNYESCDCDFYLMHLSQGQGVTRKGILLSPLQSLTENLTILSRPDRQEPDDRSVGPLYFRCDAGNPGEIYNSIEFNELETMGLVWLKAADTVFDNLSFQCNGNSYLKAACGGTGEEWAGWNEIRNTLVQNCEFAFGGGGVSFYADDGAGGVYPAVQGDGIYNLVEDTTIRHNYFHDSLCSAVTFEAFENCPATPGGSFQVLDNVICNTFGIRLDSTFDAVKHLRAVEVRGNQVWNTGRMDRGKYFYAEGAILMAPNHFGSFTVEDNVLCCSEKGYESNGLLTFISLNLTETTLPALNGNTYIQQAGRLHIYFSGMDSAWRIDDPDLPQAVRLLLLDTSSTFYIADSPLS